MFLTTVSRQYLEFISYGRTLKRRFLRTKLGLNHLLQMPEHENSFREISGGVRLPQLSYSPLNHDQYARIACRCRNLSSFRRSPFLSFARLHLAFSYLDSTPSLLSHYLNLLVLVKA